MLLDHRRGEGVRRAVAGDTLPSVRRTGLLFLAASGATAWLLWPPPALSHEVVSTTVLFDREIVRILSKKCVSCHTEDNLAFPLITYEQTRPWARSIEEEALRRHMPPWRAVRGYGEFANDNGLTARERAFIVSWVEGNGPKSAGQTVVIDIAATPKTSVPGATRPDFTRWPLGQPDLVIPLPERQNTAIHKVPSGQANQAANQTTNQTTRIVVPIDVPAARSIRGIEFKPADRRRIRAAFFSVQETGQWIGSWTPWHNAAVAPEGTAYALPPRSHIVAEIHYRETSPSSASWGSLGLLYAREPRTAPLSDLVLGATGEAPAHAIGHTFRAATTLGADTDAVALWPRLQPGAQSVVVSARKPDGAIEVLLYLKDVLEEWPTPYIFTAPVRLPKGTEIVVTATGANPSDTPQRGGVTLIISRYEPPTAGRVLPRRSP